MEPISRRKFMITGAFSLAALWASFLALFAGKRAQGKAVLVHTASPSPETKDYDAWYRQYCGDVKELPGEIIVGVARLHFSMYRNGGTFQSIGETQCVYPNVHDGTFKVVGDA